MEKEIFEELQDIFLKIIFDDEKSIDQKWKEILVIWNNLFEKTKEKIDYTRKGFEKFKSHKEVISRVKSFLIEWYKKQEGFEIEYFMEKEVGEIVKAILKLNAKVLVENITLISNTQYWPAIILENKRVEKIKEDDLKHMQRMVERGEMMEKAIEKVNEKWYNKEFTTTPKNQIIWTTIWMIIGIVLWKLVIWFVQWLFF